MVADAPPPSALASVHLNDTVFVFYVNSSSGIGYITGPAAADKVNIDTNYANAEQIEVEHKPVHVVDGFEHLGAVGYNNTQLRVYFVAKNPVNKHNVLKELCSDDSGKSWFYGSLGTKVFFDVMQGSGINAVALTGEQGNYYLRVYYTADNERSFALVWMPAPTVDAAHKIDWNSAPNLYHLDRTF